MTTVCLRIEEKIPAARDRLREAMPDQDYNVIRTNRSAANCAMFECFWRGYQIRPSAIVSAGFNWLEDRRLNSLTRRLFVLGSHGGCIERGY